MNRGVLANSLAVIIRNEAWRRRVEGINPQQQALTTPRRFVQFTPVAHPSPIVVRRARPPLPLTARKLGVSKNKLAAIQELTAKLLKTSSGRFVLLRGVPKGLATTDTQSHRRVRATKKRKP